MAASEESIANLGIDTEDLENAVEDGSKGPRKKARGCHRPTMQFYQMYGSLVDGVKEVKGDGYDLEMPSNDYAEGAATVAEIILEMLHDKWENGGAEGYNLDADELSALYETMDEIRDMAAKMRRVRLIKGAMMPAIWAFDYSQDRKAIGF